MNSNIAICIGITFSLVYDVFQIAMSWNNKVLLFIGLFSLVIALLGLQRNLSSSEEFELNWMKFYIIPAAIVVFGQLSLIEELSGKGFALAGVNVEKVLPGSPIDYLLSSEALLFSYALPFITLITYWACQSVCNILKLMKRFIEL